MKKSILKILIASLCISAFIGIIIILIGSFGEIEAKVLGTTSLVFCYSIPGLCSSSLYENDKFRAFSTFGMIFALITGLYTICLVWGIFDFEIFDSFQWKLIWTLNILCWSSGHISLILLINSIKDIVSRIKNATVILSIIFDIMILLPIWEIYSPEGFYFRLMWVIGILITLGTIGTPILNKIYNNEIKKNSNEISSPVLNTQANNKISNNEILREDNNTNL